MTTIVVAGPDESGLSAAFERAGVEVHRVEGPATGTSLAAAGIEAADILLLTDMTDASAIAVAKDYNPDVRVVTYATDSLPEFARAQADLALDPALFEPNVVVEELT